MNFGKGYKILVLSYFNIRNLRNADIVGKCNKPWKCPSDHIFDFTWSGYKIIPNMWSKLAEVKVNRPKYPAWD